MTSMATDTCFNADTLIDPCIKKQPKGVVLVRPTLLRRLSIPSPTYCLPDPSVDHQSMGKYTDLLPMNLSLILFHFLGLPRRTFHGN